MELSLVDFQGWEQATIKVEGFTVLRGESSRGKSSWARALKAILRNGVTEKQVRIGTKETRVSLSLAEHELEASRSRKGSASYVVDGAEFAKLGGTIPPVMANWGYQPVEVNGVKVDPIFAGQFDAQFLLSSSPAETSAILNAFSSTERLDQGRKTLKGRITEIDAEAKLLGAQASNLETQVADLAVKADTAAGLRADLTQQMGTARAVNRVVQALKQLQGAVAQQVVVAEKLAAIDKARFDIVRTLLHMSHLLGACKLHMIQKQKGIVAKKLTALEDVEPQLDGTLKAYLRLERIARVHSGLVAAARIKTKLAALDAVPAPLELALQRYKILVRLRALLLSDPTAVRAKVAALQGLTLDTSALPGLLARKVALLKLQALQGDLVTVDGGVSSIEQDLNQNKADLQAAEEELSAWREANPVVTCPKCHTEFLVSEGTTHEQH